MTTLAEPGAERVRVRLRWGVWLISVVALFTSVSPFLADWNVTHIYNPAWSPHAKFHNAQTMMFGLLCGVLALLHLWLPRKDKQADLRTAALFAALYWVAQIPAILFPGTGFYDPEFSAGKPRLFGVEIVQAHMAALLVLLVGWAYVAERRALMNGNYR